MSSPPSTLLSPRSQAVPSISRPSSRNSMRAPSPITEDPVAIRGQMSSLKHEIRQKQAQFNTLETLLLRGPRPLPASPPTSELALSPSSSSPNKIQRRTSWDALSSYTANGPESRIPLPVNGRQDDIREGVPLDFGVSSATLSPKRASSPTRSMSRIPVSSVGHARALAEDGRVVESVADASTSPGGTDVTAPSTPRRDTMLSISSNSNRKSLSSGNTTKVLADLQAGVMASRTALDNAKAQLRLSQRTVAQLTRQNEDLKEGRERLRLENEGLNNVVARKERLLQEVLERARKAEAEAQSLKVQLKQETTSSKRTIREMEVTVAESTAISAKSEREYITLRDSIKAMTDGWKKDLAKVKEDMAKKEKESKKEEEAMGKKYKELVRLVTEEREERAKADALKEEQRSLDKEFEKVFREQLDGFAERISKTFGDSESAKKTADGVANELARLRRLMQAAGRAEAENTH
ncbi:hypothetical protein M422DRAFT_199441 [Sphaerobolus stellatus SS14]|nr:hypothetical protein M422DRAFT_199441 [Sphaerobolus stellatus SS14]